MNDQIGYSLIDSGSGQKLERFGSYIIQRPCSQAVWKPTLPESDWRQAALFSREGQSGWSYPGAPLPDSWVIELESHKMILQPTDFGHLGIFPEQIAQWKLIQEIVRQRAVIDTAPCKVLNLFAYSGGSTLAAALAGASVCHLDSSKGMVDWARKNSEVNGLQRHPIRWIVEDVKKFCSREEKRGSCYDGIILDPPSFGRGAKGEVFKIEDEINALLRQVVRLLSEKPSFILFSCHTPGFTPITMRYLLEDALALRPDLLSSGASIAAGEMLLQNQGGDSFVRPIPSGTWALWRNI